MLVSMHVYLMTDYADCIVPAYMRTGYTAPQGVES